MIFRTCEEEKNYGFYLAFLQIFYVVKNQEKKYFIWTSIMTDEGQSEILVLAVPGAL